MPEPDLQQPVLALGLMSGTSMDGIDAALLWTDGDRIVEPRGSLSVPYEKRVRDALRLTIAQAEMLPGVDAVERAMTMAHAAAVDALLRQEGLTPDQVHVLGFHGQTILHRPEARMTWQIGDGALLAVATEIDVVSDFRSADVQAGGEGAPLVPVFHAALASAEPKPVAFLNIGGVANVTWIGPDGTLLAFDTGPGNAMLDDWCLTHTGEPLDADGRLAASGSIDRDALDALLDNPYFDRKPPKSLDRNAFPKTPVAGLSVADGAATLAAFTAQAVARAARHFPAPARRWLVCGGGRRNPTTMAMLGQALREPVVPVEDAGWDGDVMEAQAFAYLAVRSLRGMPLTFPATTGAPRPMTGGRLDRALL
jgi:anhydro-N-acetylmuramic acid kinase